VAEPTGAAVPSQQADLARSPRHRAAAPRRRFAANVRRDQHERIDPGSDRPRSVRPSLKALFFLLLNDRERPLAEKNPWHGECYLLQSVSRRTLEVHMNARNGVLAAVLVFAGVSCGGARQFILQGSDRAPGADGQVRVESQDGGNFLVTVTTTNLLPPARINEGLTTYVVWFQPAGQTPQRVGVLAYDEGDRGGQMTATTPNTTFDVVVSGEVSADVAAPSDHVVFRASVQAPE
jgi:hypothetical protein